MISRLEHVLNNKFRVMPRNSVNIWKMRYFRFEFPIILQRRKRDLYNYQLKEYLSFILIISRSDGGIQRLRTRKKKSELVLHHVKSKVKNSHKLNRSLNSLDSSSKESSPKDSNTSIFCSSDSSSSTSFCNNNSTNTNEMLSVKEAALLLLTFKYNNNNRYTNHHIHNSNPLLLLTPIPYSSMYSTFQSNCLSNWNNSCFHCNPSYSYQFALYLYLLYSYCISFGFICLLLLY